MEIKIEENVPVPETEIDVTKITLEYVDIPKKDERRSNSSVAGLSPIIKKMEIGQSFWIDHPVIGIGSLGKYWGIKLKTKSENGGTRVWRIS